MSVHGSDRLDRILEEVRDYALSRGWDPDHPSVAAALDASTAAHGEGLSHSQACAAGFVLLGWPDDLPSAKGA
jgi:hypothetical protein